MPRLLLALMLTWARPLVTLLAFSPSSFSSWKRQNRFARFHALQSILYHVGAVVIFIVLGILLGILMFVLSMISSSLAAIGGILLWLGYMLAVLVYLAGLLFCAFKAYGGASMKLPVIGGMTDKILNK